MIEDPPTADAESSDSEPVEESIDSAEPQEAASAPDEPFEEPDGELIPFSDEPLGEYLEKDAGDYGER